ncbi:NAD-glutamate dehydrogenase [Enterovirga rhinocerotis]|uniref:Glutamate dehydrogenase n=1 Tax=Enterovirga rhinocerotis TaxID=1339210 RepID=A0A4R7BK68_9HYPH|nr:NAD-glutamate dehydrogenase [Enterovirga rhinocerotis]TDR85423.1 glutamate dehydrogenase [Enterovirga rhinocerotis]
MDNDPGSSGSDAANAGTDAAMADRFREALFARVPAEDLAAVGTAAQSSAAASAFVRLEAPRRAGQPAITLSHLTVEEDGRPRELTVLDAVNDDMPFLLDSTLAVLVLRGYEPRLVAHPILAVERDGEGRLTALKGEATAATRDEGTTRESFIHVHLDRIDDETARSEVIEALSEAYADVAAVARDRVAMRSQIEGLASEYRTNSPQLPEGEREEALAFLNWLTDEHFILLGMRASRIPDGEGIPQPLDGSGLGLLSDPSVHVLKRGGQMVSITPEIRAFMDRPQALIVTKASVRSRVLRPSYMDYIGAKLFSPSGKLWGELAIVGLFTASAYSSPATATPYLRRKVDGVVRRAGFDPASFAGRTLVETLEAFPRDELFQIDEETLETFAIEVLRLREHPRIRALVRVDRFDRFVSIMVYLPKDRDDAGTRARIGAYLAKTYEGRVSANYPAFLPGVLTRTHYIIGRDGSATPQIDRETLEAGIAAIARTWGDRLGEALGRTIGGARARELGPRYGAAFGAAYREAFDPEAALGDIERIEQLSENRPRGLDLYRRPEDEGARVSLKLFSRGQSLALSERVPLLERMGFRVLNERTYRVAAPGTPKAETVWLHDMALERATGGPIDIEALDLRMEAALLAVFRGVAESDAYNKLVLEADLGWRDTALLRSYGRYLQQLTIPYSQAYIADVLARHGRLARSLVALAYARFDPSLAGEDSEARASEARTAIEAYLADVTSLDEDRILRRFHNLVEATLRTNFFQLGRDGLPANIIAFKFDCAKVEGMPKPRPLFEIFVTSPRVEGVHLRFGKVARGGLRWTDRPQDFRTEVLGLVKAQQVKNAVIVPVGAKGGFFPKQLPPASDRAAWMAEGTEAYRLFIRTLLDLTDNIDGDTIVAPPETVRHDADDPYLVVAADKGTATFSDVANAISVERGHWLGDAFASGGSNGYDHKAMGITARGAWEAVKRHFREIDIDIQAQPVTVAGVGDMSGDVFGNGMLLSKELKVVAAFDHRDIFIDPTPDPASSWAERKRLFDLPRSSWQDYDTALISAGGGVFPRSLKSIALSPEARAAIGLDQEHATPTEVMTAILKAPVDLLWFGGIGTYIRAAAETNAEAGDRANDPIRVTGAELRAKVVGEGANLGMTQRGRIEAARRGIRLNTDAIDNSAGVNTSDVEVNIKIALTIPERDGRLDAEARNALLRQMTDEVAALVLRNNYLQTLALSLGQRRGVGDLGFQARLMQRLEASGSLDRSIEFLPDEAALAERRHAGEGLTRPELAVLLAYAKLALHDELLSSSVPDDPFLSRELERYFPAELREAYPDAVSNHRLRREIIATQLSNAIINRGGPAVVTRLVDDTGADAVTIAAAYAATRDVFGLTDLYNAIDALDGRIGGERQLDLYCTVQDVMFSRIVWFIRNVDFKSRTLDDVVGQYRDGAAGVADSLEQTLPQASLEAWAARREAMEADGVPADLARRLAALPEMIDAPDIVLVSRRSEVPVTQVAATHFALDGIFGLGALVEAGAAIPVADHFDRLARDRAIDAVSLAHRRLTSEVVARGGDVEAWHASRDGEIDRIRAAVAAIVASDLTVSKLTVAASLIGDLAKE